MVSKKMLKCVAGTLRTSLERKLYKVLTFLGMQNFIFKTGIHISDYCLSFLYFLPSLFTFLYTFPLLCKHNQFREKFSMSFTFLKIIFAKYVCETFRQLLFLLFRSRNRKMLWFLFDEYHGGREWVRESGEKERERRGREGRRERGMERKGVNGRNEKKGGRGG